MEICSSYFDALAYAWYSYVHARAHVLEPAVTKKRNRHHNHFRELNPFFSTCPHHLRRHTTHAIFSLRQENTTLLIGKSLLSHNSPSYVFLGWTKQSCVSIPFLVFRCPLQYGLRSEMYNYACLVCTLSLCCRSIVHYS